MQKGVSHILEETWVKASEAHYDAKLWPHVHPFGTGSVYSEPGAGGLHHHARNRLTSTELVSPFFIMGTVDRQNPAPISSCTLPRSLRLVFSLILSYMKRCGPTCSRICQASIFNAGEEGGRLLVRGGLGFCRSTGFWYLSRLIQAELFFKNSKRREFKKKTASAADEPDPVTRLFGTAMPSDIPESTAWWQRQTRDLLAASDDAEMGLMQVMVTLTANDTCPEMLAAIRRGPLAKPTNDELIEYLLARKRRDQERPPYEHYSLEHVLSFQRRVKAVKQFFFKRGVVTPLGIVQDFWDRPASAGRV